MLNRSASAPQGAAIRKLALVGFGRGLVAGCGFLVAELAARVIAGVPTLPELVQDRVVQALPGPLFSLILDRLLYLGKPLFFGSLLLAQLVLGGLVGLILARWHRPVEILAALWVLTGAVLPPLSGQPAFAASAAVALTSLLAFAIYGLVLEALVQPALSGASEPDAGTPFYRAVARRDVLGASSCSRRRPCWPGRRLAICRCCRRGEERLGLGPAQRPAFRRRSAPRTTSTWSLRTSMTRWSRLTAGICRSMAWSLTP